MAPIIRCKIRSRVLFSSNSGLSTGPPKSGRYSVDRKSMFARHITQEAVNKSIAGQSCAKSLIGVGVQVYYRYARLRRQVCPSAPGYSRAGHADPRGARCSSCFVGECHGTAARCLIWTRELLAKTVQLLTIISPAHEVVSKAHLHPTADNAGPWKRLQYL